MAQEKVIDIQELAQDQHNFNKGNEQGQELMERSFKELGAGRSILLDKNGNIIAGNKSQKAAIAAGIKRVRVIETTGDELVAVKRTAVDIDAAEGRKITVLDPSVRPDKYDAPGREGKVELVGNIAYTDMQVIAKDCDNRYPSYALFRKK